ncbi:hypothetical protein DFH28DRAFT_1127577 [Melampsora americana]|nr:hypothetical protein DFH28DRAFT_1127577 [Melampsora americana]
MASISTVVWAICPRMSVHLRGESYGRPWRTVRRAHKHARQAAHSYAYDGVMLADGEQTRTRWSVSHAAIPRNSELLSDLSDPNTLPDPSPDPSPDP